MHAHGTLFCDAFEKLVKRTYHSQKPAIQGHLRFGVGIQLNGLFSLEGLRVWHLRKVDTLDIGHAALTNTCRGTNEALHTLRSSSENGIHIAQDIQKSLCSIQDKKVAHCPL